MLTTIFGINRTDHSWSQVYPPYFRRRDFLARFVRFFLEGETDLLA
ncbi:MAG: hypothetical protein ACKVT2_10505 [Saprospiraceae bacterium]